MGTALPLLFVAMCTYIANDLDDIEKDRVNHPSRPLPRNELRPSVAAALYFISLALALVTIRLKIEGRAAFAYYVLLTASISYSYIVEWFPVAKAFYVAAALAGPIVIVALIYPSEYRLRVLIAAVFLLNFGREICKDVVDRPGDNASVMHRLPAQAAAIGAFVVQASGLGLLVTQAVAPRDFLIIGLMIAICAYVSRLWFALGREHDAIVLMKLELLLGLHFLL